MRGRGVLWGTSVRCPRPDFSEAILCGTGVDVPPHARYVEKCSCFPGGARVRGCSCWASARRVPPQPALPRESGARGARSTELGSLVSLGLPWAPRASGEEGPLPRGLRRGPEGSRLTVLPPYFA
uniref:Uncharacterized protein n=1 Tax=Molossus molossus TaxID=27622 RepID=A0A7J8C908_MOLMO|nr:hypothetical protein HJG59_009941 [Molossus molossus]